LASSSGPAIEPLLVAAGTLELPLVNDDATLKSVMSAERELCFVGYGEALIAPRP
jgi:hypothetical protein